jgi:hypothetical protein
MKEMTGLSAWACLVIFQVPCSSSVRGGQQGLFGSNGTREPEGRFFRVRPWLENVVNGRGRRSVDNITHQLSFTLSMQLTIRSVTLPKLGAVVENSARAGDWHPSTRASARWIE